MEETPPVTLLQCSKSCVPKPSPSKSFQYVPEKNQLTSTSKVLFMSLSSDVIHTYIIFWLPSQTKREKTNSKPAPSLTLRRIYLKVKPINRGWITNNPTPTGLFLKCLMVEVWMLDRSCWSWEGGANLLKDIVVGWKLVNQQLPQSSFGLKRAMCLDLKLKFDLRLVEDKYIKLKTLR